MSSENTSLKSSFTLWLKCQLILLLAHLQCNIGSFTGAAVGVNTSSEKLQTLGWSFRPLEETISDSIESYKQGGILD